MKKLKSMVMLGAAFGLLSFGFNLPGIARAASQTTCPVMGGKIDRNIYADYKGKRLYFCCTGCLEEFKKEPEKYIKKMEAEGVAAEEAPSK